MRIVYAKPIPRKFTGCHPNAKGIVAEGDIRMFRRGNLFAKLLIFDLPSSLRRFWKKALGGDIGGDCLGVVNALGRTRQKMGKTPDQNEPAVLECDPRYFCIVGLCKEHLTPEIIMHEAVHAAYCYEKRVQRNLFGAVAEFDEERIAYPTGMIGAGINAFLHRNGLYKD